MTTMIALLSKKLDLVTELGEVENKIEKLQAKTVIVCEGNAAFGKGCGQKFFIKNLQYIQTHWYEKPYGCTGGDNWHVGEGQFICPCCSHRNRFLGRKEFEDLKHLFGSVIDEYKD